MLMATRPPPGVWIKVVKERLCELVIDGGLSPASADAALTSRATDVVPDEELAAALASGPRSGSVRAAR
jgi:hypothetical protein